MVVITNLSSSRLSSGRKDSNALECPKSPTTQDVHRCGELPPGYLKINRPVFDLERYDKELGCRFKGEPLRQRLFLKVKKNYCTCTLSCWISALFSFIPVCNWIQSFSIKKDLIADILGGLTVGVMSIPQGMAYARLARMPPVYGLYTNFVPTIIYFFFGTSKHAAIGAATVTSLMMGAIRSKYIQCEDCWTNNSTNNDSSMNVNEGQLSLLSGNATVPLTPIEVGSTVAFVVGVFLVIMGLLHLNIVTFYLSDQIVSGFTAGAAVHIFTAQLDAVFGIRLADHSGIGKLFFEYIDLFSSIHKTNVAALIISLVTLLFLILLKFLINPLVQKKLKLKIIIPGELIVVIIGSLCSYLLNVRRRYNVKIVDYISQSLPYPAMPRFDFMPSVMLDSFVLAIVTYCQSVSQAKMYAKMHNYKINTQQEFFAYGIMNIFGSFFQCFNSAMSVSRSIVYERSGARTQLAGLIGTSVVVITILVLAPFLEPLPQSVLAAIIIVACIDLLRQMKDLTVLWKVSKVDFAIYLVTFFAIILLDVTYGLLVSVFFALFTVILRTQCQHVVAIGSVHGTDLYADVGKFSKVEELSGIKIVTFDAPLYYANVDGFKKNLFKLFPHIKDADTCQQHEYLIINCSGILYMDIMGVNTLKESFSLLHSYGICVLFAHTKQSLYKLFHKIHLFDVIPKESFFATVHDAVTYAKNQPKLPSLSLENSCQQSR